MLPYGYQVPCEIRPACHVVFGVCIFYYTRNTMSASSKTETEGLSSTLIDIGGDPFDTAELIRIASARNAAAACVDAFDAFEDQFAVYRHHSVANGKRQAYEAWVKAEDERLSRDKKSSGFLSLISLNAANEFLHTFRFRDYSSLIRWLRSDEHRDWGRMGQDLCKELGHDVSQGGASFLPASMSRVAKRMFDAQTKRKVALSKAGIENLDDSVQVKTSSSSKRCAPFQLWGRDDQCCGKKFAIQGPEPEWRKSIVIWCSACSLFTP